MIGMCMGTSISGGRRHIQPVNIKPLVWLSWCYRGYTYTCIDMYIHEYSLLTHMLRILCSVIIS